MQGNIYLSEDGGNSSSLANRNLVEPLKRVKAEQGNILATRKVDGTLVPLH